MISSLKLQTEPQAIKRPQIAIFFSDYSTNEYIQSETEGQSHDKADEDIQEICDEEETGDCNNRSEISEYERFTVQEVVHLEDLDEKILAKPGQILMYISESKELKIFEKKS